MELMSPVVSTKIFYTLDIPEVESENINIRSNLEKAQTSQPSESIATSKPKRVIYRPTQYTDIVCISGDWGSFLHLHRIRARYWKSEMKEGYENLAVWVILHAWKKAMKP